MVSKHSSWTASSAVFVLAIGLAGCGGMAVDESAGPDEPPASTSSEDAPAYALDPSWPPPLPNGWVMGVPTSVSVDPRDHVWVLHRPRAVPEERLESAAPAVVEFDADGAFVQAWGGPGEGYAWPDTEHGIFVDHENKVWVTGINPRAGGNVSDRSDDMLLKFTQDGTLLFQVGGFDASGGNADTENPRQPADVGVYAPTGEVFVADGYGNRRVWVLDAETGAFKRQWGAFGNEPEDAIPVGAAMPPAAAPADPAPLETEGPGPDQFGIVHGIGISNDGHVYVADRGNRRIQVFTVAGEFVTQGFVNRTGPAPSTAARVAFSADPDQRFIFTNDFSNGRVWILDRQTLETVGEFGSLGSDPGQFRNLHHIAVDSHNNVYGAEVGQNRRVQKFVATSTQAATQTGAQEPSALQQLSRRTTSTMNNPYRMLQNWPTLRSGMEWGAAIGLIPDNTGGTWMMFRSEPPINYIDASGTITRSFGEGSIVQAHGFCMGDDGNLWAGDSGPFGDDPSTRGRGFQIHKFSQDGALLMSLGQAGVSAAAEDTFIGPTACAVAPNGDIIIADGHWPRPSDAQQDGDRLVRITKEGEFIKAVGRLGSGPGEFMGPHALAFDSQGRLFVADRSNNRVQILDQDLNFVDEWRHFGRPSGITILEDDTLIVSDSESGAAIPGPPVAPEGGGRAVRNPGWQVGVRIGNAQDGSLRYFIPGTRPEGLAGDEMGNIFAGLTGGCDASPSGGCLQKWVKP